ncbi:MAG: hypothetical protein LKCHEGNO_02557 [Burkholderiaceae bacterium]|nr:hypothetical protein [Burkholderiaceae bacterium]
MRAVGQHALAQPAQPGLALGAVEHGLQRVSAVRAPHARGHREQMQVVVAEQMGRRAVECAQPLQHPEAVGAAVDEVAQRVHVVARRREADFGEQTVQRVATALYVADQEVHVSAMRPPGGSACGSKVSILLR